MSTTVREMTALSKAALDEIRTCECGCCRDARSRLRCGAFLAYSCWCMEPAFDDEGEPVEPCACVFCVEQVASPPTTTTFSLGTN